MGINKVKVDRDESFPYVSMIVSQGVTQRCEELGITSLCIKLRVTEGNKTNTPSLGAQFPF